MKLRFRVLSPGNSGAPDYFICGQAAAVVNNTNLGIELKVDGEVIWSTSDVSGYAFPVPIVTVANTLTVTSTGIANVDYYTVEITGLAVWQSTSVELTITKAGYIQYHNIYTVFGYDLGNNPNDLYSNGNPVTNNPDMDVRLINETNNVVSGIQTRAYSSFTAYYRPFTNELNVYKLDSSGGDVDYFDADGVKVLKTRNGVICLNGGSIRQVTKVYDSGTNCGCGAGGAELLDTCQTALFVYSKLRDIPKLGITVSCIDCVPGQCSSFLNTFIGNGNLDFGATQTYWVGDDLAYAFDNLDLKYSVFDSNGLNTGNATYSIGSIVPNYVFDPSLYPFSNIPIPNVGDYIVRMMISSSYTYPSSFVQKIFECQDNTPVHVCHWYEIEKTDCNKYRVSNHSFTDKVVTVSKLISVSTFELVSTTTILTNTSNDYTLADGIYKFELIDGANTYIYIVIVYCGIQQCILRYLNDIICCKPKQDCAEVCQLYYDFNSLILNAHTFFAMLNEEYSFAFIYEALTPNTLSNLFDIQLFIDNMKKYCRSCDTGCKGCGGTTSHKDTGCGCGGKH